MKKNLIYSKFHRIVLVLTTEYWNNNFLPAGRLEFFFAPWTCISFNPRPKIVRSGMPVLKTKFYPLHFAFSLIFWYRGLPTNCYEGLKGWWLLRLTFKILANLRLTVNAFPLFPSDIFFTANFFYAKRLNFLAVLRLTVNPIEALCHKYIHREKEKLEGKVKCQILLTSRYKQRCFIL